jgi:hypothetical protein
MNPWLPISSWRPFKENERFLSTPLFDALLKGIFFIPSLHQAFFHGYRIEVGHGLWNNHSAWQ